MLHEGDRLIKPEDIAKQVDWKKFDAVVILGLGKIGQESELFMSTLTLNELCFLQAQLQAAIAYKLGPMKEG